MQFTVCFKGPPIYQDGGSYYAVSMPAIGGFRAIEEAKKLECEPREISGYGDSPLIIISEEIAREVGLFGNRSHITVTVGESSLNCLCFLRKYSDGQIGWCINTAALSDAWRKAGYPYPFWSYAPKIVDDGVSQAPKEHNWLKRLLGLK